MNQCFVTSINFAQAEIMNQTTTSSGKCYQNQLQILSSPISHRCIAENGYLWLTLNFCSGIPCHKKGASAYDSSLPQEGGKGGGLYSSSGCVPNSELAGAGKIFLWVWSKNNFLICSNIEYCHNKAWTLIISRLGSVIFTFPKFGKHHLLRMRSHICKCHRTFLRNDCVTHVFLGEGEGNSSNSINLFTISIKTLKSGLFLFCHLVGRHTKPRNSEGSFVWIRDEAGNSQNS